MSHRVRQRRRGRRSHTLRTTLLLAALLLVTALAIGGGVVASWVIGIVDETPSIDELRPKPQRAVSAVYAADGSRLGFIAGDVLRVPLNGRGVPAELRRATIAIEDRRFYRHGGVDLVGIARAAAENVVNGRTVQGGSSLTMQLVRNLYLPGTRYERTLERKVREAKLASDLESEHSKGWILARYLDDIPYGTVGGQTAVGVQAAARVFLPSEPTWSVATDDHEYHGSIDLAEAIAVSDNTVYAQLGADLGGEAVRQAAYDMGVTSHLDGFPAESIGGLRLGVTPLEMANAFATIADGGGGGWRNTATVVDAVTRDGEPIAPQRPAQRRKEFTDGQTHAVVQALEGVLDHGTAAGLGLGCPAAGKTGTTSSFTDAWFVGFTPALSTAVWVGYPAETASMDAVPGYGEVFGATIPAPIWQQYMLGALGGACDAFPQPTEPFTAQPFDGSHESGGGDDVTADTGEPAYGG